MQNTTVARTLFTPTALGAMRARSGLRGAALVAHAWIIIASGAALFVLWPNPLTFLLAVCIIGSRQLGLVILMHDGAHGLLAHNAKFNRRLSQWLCAWPMLADTHVYRRYHLQHHAHTLQDNDPDKVLTGGYPITRRSLRRKLLRDITGQTGFHQRKAQFIAAAGPKDWPWRRRLGHFARGLGPQVGANLTVFALVAALGYWYLYPLLWVVPLLTWHQLVLRVRNIAEHAVIRDKDDPFGNARTTLANPLERLFIAPYWVNYHLEHHLLMWVPCYRLPKLRKALIAGGFGERMQTAKGYLQMLRDVTVDGPENKDGIKEKQRATGTFSDGFAS